MEGKDPLYPSLYSPWDDTLSAIRGRRSIALYANRAAVDYALILPVRSPSAAVLSLSVGLREVGISILQVRVLVPMAKLAVGAHIATLVVLVLFRCTLTPILVFRFLHHICSDDPPSR